VIRVLGVGSLFVGLGALLVVGASVSLCDFHAPQTDLLDANLSFSYRYFDDPGTTGVDVNSGWLKLNYQRVADAPEVGFSLSGLATVYLGDFVPTGGTGSASATMRYYVSDEIPLFAFGGLESSVATGQPNPGLEVRAGAGYGRFSDVTPLAKAFRIQRELVAMRSLSRALGDEALLAVAAEIGKQVEYENIEDLVGVIESLIETDAGVILDARALLAVEDIILQQGDERSCGWAVQAGLGYEVVDPLAEPRNVLLTASADAAFARAVGSQWVLRCSLSGPFNILQRHTLTATASGELVLSADASLLADFSLQRVQPLGRAASNSMSCGASLSFDVGGADVSIQLALSKDAGETEWSRDITLAASMDLLRERKPMRAWDSGSFERD